MPSWYVVKRDGKLHTTLKPNKGERVYGKARDRGNALTKAAQAWRKESNDNG